MRGVALLIISVSLENYSPPLEVTLGVLPLNRLKYAENVSTFGDWIVTRSTDVE